MHLFHKKHFLYVIMFCGKKFDKLLCIYVPCALFSGQKPDAIFIVVLVLGVSIMLFSYEGDEFSATDSLSWFSSSTSSKIWAFGGTCGKEVYFPWRLISIPFEPFPASWIIIGMEYC